MPLSKFTPKTGALLICDFERGFVPPEMVKRRPVVVISGADSHWRRLCTVIPLSTTEPDPVQRWHYELSRCPLPDASEFTRVWAKCDMITTVSFDRLDKPYRKTRTSRDYMTIRLPEEDIQGIRAALLRYLPLIR